MKMSSIARKSSATAILGVLALALVQGCASFTPPSVQVVGVELIEVGLTEGLAEVTLDVVNEGLGDLNVKGILYDLQVNSASEGASWATLSNGFFEGDFSVRRGQRERVTVPVAFDYQALGEAVRAFLNQGEVPYRLSGEVWVGGADSGLQIPFRKDGVLGS